MTEMLGGADVHRIRSATAQLDVADSPVSGRNLCLADLRSSVKSMAASRPNLDV